MGQFLLSVSYNEAKLSEIACLPGLKFGMEAELIQSDETDSLMHVRNAPWIVMYNDASFLISLQKLAHNLYKHCSNLRFKNLTFPIYGKS